MATSPPGLDIEDLKFIVKLCVKNKILKLKWKSLELEFGERQVLNQLGEPHISERKQKPVKEITDEQRRAQTKAGLEEDELNLREEQILDLQLTDPQAAEEMILNGELDDDSGDDDQSGE